MLNFGSIARAAHALRPLANPLRLHHTKAVPRDRPPVASSTDSFDVQGPPFTKLSNRELLLQIRAGQQEARREIEASREADRKERKSRLQEETRGDFLGLGIAYAGIAGMLALTAK